MDPNKLFPHYWDSNSFYFYIVHITGKECFLPENIHTPHRKFF